MLAITLATPLGAAPNGRDVGRLTARENLVILLNSRTEGLVSLFVKRMQWTIPGLGSLTRKGDCFASPVHDARDGFRKIQRRNLIYLKARLLAQQSQRTPTAERRFRIG